MTTSPALRAWRRDRRLRAAAGCLPLLLLLACGPANTDAAPLPDDTNLDAGMISDTLQLGIEAPDRLPAGEPVPITLQVRNVSGRALDLHLRGRTVAFDLIVSDPDGRDIWRRLEGEFVPAILRLENLAAGGVLEFTDAWDQRTGAGERVPAGAYYVRGELLTDGEPLVTPKRPLGIDPL